MVLIDLINVRKKCKYYNILESVDLAIAVIIALTHINVPKAVISYLEWSELVKPKFVHSTLPKWKLGLQVVGSTVRFYP